MENLSFALNLFDGGIFSEYEHHKTTGLNVSDTNHVAAPIIVELENNTDDEDNINEDV